MFLKVLMNIVFSAARAQFRNDVIVGLHVHYFLGAKRYWCYGIPGYTHSLKQLSPHTAPSCRHEECSWQATVVITADWCRGVATWQ